MTTTLLMAFLAIIAVLFFLWQPEKPQEMQTDNNNISDSTKLPDISGSRLRVLSATDLINRLNLEPVIENIKLHSGLSSENWKNDGLPLIHNFLLLVQRLPASESHHHAGDGGLARHTLDVAAIALRQAAGRSFPPNGKTEDIPKLTAVWKYGILVAALLHDVGKVLTGFTITLSDKDAQNSKTWLPDTGYMPINMYYTVDFLEENQQYSKHAEIGWSFFMTLVPESTRQWIGNMSPDLIHLLRSYLSGCHNSNIIEELVKSADMASVSRDLASGNRQRFATAKRTPLIEIIMDNLCEMLSERGRYFTVAKDAGGDLFRKGDKIYMISKNVPDYIRAFLNQNNPNLAQSFPTDNNRIFDTLLEYQAILPNPFDENKAITNIAVSFIKGDKTSVQTNFTVLAFNAKTLYPDGNYPTEFTGKLEEIVEPIRNTENPEPAVETTKNNEPAEEIIVPPMMNKPANTPEPAKEAPSTSLEALLGIEPAEDTVIASRQTVVSGSTAYDSVSQNEAKGLQSERSNPLATSTETNVSGNLNAEPTPSFSSIDDLLNLSGLLNSEPAEEQDNHSGSLNNGNAEPARQPENEVSALSQKPEPVKNKKENQQEKLKKLKSIFGDDFNGKDKQNDNKAEIIEENNAVIEMPRPIPVKTPMSLDNIQTAISDIRIKKALSDRNYEDASPFKQQGLKFLHYLADGLADGSISFNNSLSFIHFIEAGMLVVSPAAFRAFTGEFNNKNPNCMGKKTQMGFELLNLVERGSRRTSLYRAFNPQEEALFFCYLIPNSRLHYLIQMSTRPANNPNLKIIPADELFYKKR